MKSSTLRKMSRILNEPVLIAYPRSNESRGVTGNRLRWFDLCAGAGNLTSPMGIGDLTLIGSDCLMVIGLLAWIVDQAFTATS